MASEITVDAGAPNLNLSPDEKRVYGQLFRQADTDNVGVVTGEIAVKFFEKTRLDSRILGEIWQIADKENRGFLTPAGFGIVLRLIGHAQAGREPTRELALQQGPIPRFDGFAPAPPAPISTQATGAGPAPVVPIQAQGTGGGGGGPIRIPPLTPEKVAQYTTLFERQNLQDGNMLPGDQAKQIFEKSGLPTEILGRIWQLADTELRGALVLTEFIIAMHLLTSMKTGNLHGLPNILPAALYEAATRRGPPPPAAQRQTSPTGPGPMTAVPRQLTGQMRTGSPLGRSPLAPQTTGDWLITPGDKARWDQLYDELDRTRKGFITGEEAVPFLSQSKLGEDALAQIWDLSDIRSEGRLNRDTFAVAMYLIRQQRSRQDGSSSLPPALPPNLIPPSMRNQIRPPTATSAFDAPAPAPVAAPPPPQPPAPQPKSALDDLFGLDSSPSPAPAAPSQAAGAGLSDPFASSPSPLRPSSPAKPSPTTSSFRPFVPSSSFGRTLTAQATGDSNSSAAASFSKPTSSSQLPIAAAPAAQEDDLLGDNDAEISKKLTSDTAELANLSTQIGSLSKHMQEVQGQRTTTENQLNQTSLQKKNFEQRLAQLRALYEKEAKDVRTLEEQLNASRNETKKIQGELIMLEGSYQELQQQHRQISAAFQADQQENANLKEKIRAVNGEIAQLKPQIEKLKSDARQQKGLAAINKKQLATTEGERDKFKTEVEDLTKSNEELARQISASPPPPAAAPAAAIPAQLASPALSTSSGNNPFFKRSGSTDIMGAFASPPANKSLNDKAFDDVFGPSFAVAPAQTATPPPPMTSFKPQNTGTSTGSAASFATPATSTPTVSRQATVGLEPPPPPPPESRQMSSSFLPFGDATESLTSSRQVSPPVSRLGQVDTILSEPTSNLVASPLEPTATGQSIGSTADSAKLAAEPNHRPTSNGDSLFGGGTTAAAAGEEGSAKAGGGGGGATGGHSHSDSLNDPFSASDQAKAKQQFDDAFANFNTIRTTKEAEPIGGGGSIDAAKAFKNFATEFPPIAQLEKDDDYSDSESDQGGGFDDDFAPASPRGGAEKNDTTTIKPVSPTLSKTGLPDGLSGAGASATASFDDFTSSSEKAATPTPAAPSAATAVSNISGPKLDDIFGVSSSTPQPGGGGGGSSSNQAAAASKAPFDDLDDDFDGLEDAKEGSADDDFATISRSGLDDFNPVFDSSPPASHATKSESNLTGTTAPFGIESSFDFASLGSSTGGGGGGGSSGSPGAPPPHQNGSATGGGGGSGGAKSAADGHDWDALFSDLEEATPGTSSAAVTETAAAAKSGEKPALGRALTEEGEHDAPMLKSLVSMGYSRSDALSALEKYDYNLDRAANYLANES